MTARLKYFRQREQLLETQRFLNGHNIKSYVREHKREKPEEEAAPIGYDLYILRDEDVEDAKKLLDYEFGTEWGEATS